MIAAADGARFAFAKLVVRNLERESAFYRAVCGYEVSELIRADMGERPIAEIILRTSEGDLDLVLLTYLDVAPSGQNGAIVALDTPDLDAFQARLLDAGGTLVHPIESVEIGMNRMRIGFFADPEENLLEVMER